MSSRSDMRFRIVEVFNIHENKLEFEVQFYDQEFQYNTKEVVKKQKLKKRFLLWTWEKEVDVKCNELEEVIHERWVPAYTYKPKPNSLLAMEKVDISRYATLEEAKFFVENYGTENVVYEMEEENAEE